MYVHCDVLFSNGSLVVQCSSHCIIPLLRREFARGFVKVWPSQNDSGAFVLQRNIKWRV